MLGVQRRLPRMLVNSMKLFAARSFSSTAAAWNDEENNKSFVPVSNRVPDQEIEKLQEFVDKSDRIFVLTGAGISTESGIPDYKSKDVGLFARKETPSPMQHSEFISNENDKQQRYWAGSYRYWERLIRCRPNDSHFILADWERRGKVFWTMTQNFDALHTMGGSQNLTEIHGSLTRVRCLKCGDISPRHELQVRLRNLNPDWKWTPNGLRPDGEECVSKEDVAKFNMVSCAREWCDGELKTKCEGPLKPDIWFVGDNAREIKDKRMLEILSLCDSMLILGTSLVHGRRFLDHAEKLGIPIGCINIGPTEADDLFEFKIEGKCSDILKRVNVAKSS